MNISRGKQLTAQKVLIYGVEGIGKSTFASQFPRPLFIDTEGSTKHMDVMRFDPPTSWSMLLDQVAYVKAHPSCCETLVIDTADWAERLCISNICAKRDVTGIEDFGYGKGYTYVVEDFGKLLNRLDELIELCINVVITAHAYMRKIEQPEEMGTYDHWELKMGKKTAPMLKEWADMVLFANYEVYAVKTKEGTTKAQGGKRVMYTSHTPWWDAKNRHGLPEKLDFDYKKIADKIPALNVAAASPAPAAEPAQPAAQAETSPAAKEAQKDALKAKIDRFVEDDLAEVPPALADLMRGRGISAFEIQQVVTDNGYFPAETPIKNYPQDFIDGWLIAYWDQIADSIIKKRG